MLHERKLFDALPLRQVANGMTKNQNIFALNVEGF